MILAGHQPNYLPYPGFFGKMLLAEKFVIVDHVQVKTKEWQTRNRIAAQKGAAQPWQWLTLPIRRQSLEDPISAVSLDMSMKTLRKHWRTLELVYQKYPFWAEIERGLGMIYHGDWTTLVSLNRILIEALAAMLEITAKPILCTSELKPITAKSTRMLIELCRQYGASGYLSGEGAHDYVEEALFEEAGLSHQYAGFEPIQYESPHGPVEPNLSVVDAICCIGAEETRRRIECTSRICR